MKLYQLKCEGTFSFFTEKMSFYSGKVFKTKDEALGYGEEFIERCTSPIHDKDFRYLSKDEPLKISVIELELVE